VPCQISIPERIGARRRTDNLIILAVAMASWFGWSLIADGNDGMTGVSEK
jgi:hypothetical protein